MKDLLSARIFSGFPSWKDMTYQKEMTPKILRFEVKDGEELRPVYLASIISKDEKMAWQSFQDVLEHTAGLAQKNMRGFFGLDVLSVDIRSGMQAFNPGEFSRLLINHARELGPDQKALIRYGQMFSLLHYRAPAEWGKIEVKTHADFFSPAAASGEVTEASVRDALLGKGGKSKKTSGDSWDLFLKKLMRESGGEPRAIFLVHDLSIQPLWDPSDIVQKERVDAWLEKEAAARGGNPPELYYFHAGNCRAI